MTGRLGIYVLLLFCSVRTLAINATVSHTLFYTQADGRWLPNADVSWQITPRTINFKTTPEKTIVGKVRTDIVFTNATGIIREHHFIMQTVPRTDVNELDAPIIDLRRYPLATGMITMKFTLTDMADSNNRFVYTDSFMIEPVGSKPFFSEIQLLDTIIANPAQTIFTKNGKQQIPASANFLDDNKKSVHYYAELYQTEKISSIDYPLVSKVFISRRENEGPMSKLINVDTIKTPQQLVYLSGRFPVTTLTSGNYYLTATLENSTRKTVATASRFFQRYNAHPEAEAIEKKAAETDTALENVTVLNLDKTFLAKYNLAQIRAILKMILPITDPINAASINTFLKKPDELYMRYFIYNFFAAINKKDPTKAWKEYSERILEVNKKFSARGLPGYETERGTMYLRYGPPSDIITVANESGTFPYEIWQYNVLTQTNKKDIPDAVFLFYKPNEISSDYTLLHSNVAGEVLNKSWRTYLYVNQQGGNNGNSRAEQYIGNR